MHRAPSTLERQFTEDGLPFLRLDDFADSCRIKPFVLEFAKAWVEPNYEEDLLVQILECLEEDIASEDILLDLQQHLERAVRELISEGRLQECRPERPGCPGTRMIQFAD